MKDVFGVGVFFILFAIVVFFVPTFGGLFLEAPNFEPANPMSTPEHIAPVWYFTPYYAILRAVPDQRLGALLMGLAVLAFLFVPWLDRSPVKSIRYKGWVSRTALALFAMSFIATGLPRPAAGGRPVRGARAHLRGGVLRLFCRLMVLPEVREDQAGAGKGDLRCALRCGPPCRPGAAWRSRPPC